MVCSRDGTKDGSILTIVGETFSGEESAASLGDLEDNGRLDISMGRTQYATSRHYFGILTEQLRERHWQLMTK
jgi:hypothetical protein